MANRVVVTGMGVVSPIGVGLKAFDAALREGTCGLKFHEAFEELGLGCWLGGIPAISAEEEQAFTKRYNLVKLRGSGILYGCMAAVEAWLDAGLPISQRRAGAALWDSGCIFGTSCSGVEAFVRNVLLTRDGNIRKVGGRLAQQAMNSGVSAYIGGILGLGNQVTTNASEGNTGSESIWNAYFRIRNGQAQRMIAGSTESSSPYVFHAYDSVMTDDKSAFMVFQEKGTYKDSPQTAYTPLSMKNSGFVIGVGSGALILESLKSAVKRGAKIYGEILGGRVTSGGLRLLGGIKKTNLKAFQSCIEGAITASGIHPSDIAYINGNFQNFDDDLEIRHISAAIKRTGADFPYINDTKSLTGHCLSGSGSIETVATFLQMNGHFLHPAINAKPLAPAIAALVADSSVPDTTLYNIDIPIAMKINTGIGDVYSCLIYKEWN